MTQKSSTLPLSKLTPPNDLETSGRTAIAAAINPIIADAFALYIKTKNYHWHVSGHYFRDYHLLFDDQATQIYAIIDALAERVRKLGCTTIHSVSDIAQLTEIADDNNPFVEPNAMLLNLMNDNKNYAARLRAAHEVCDKYNDIATASLLENFIDQTEGRTWFLYETAVNNQ